MYDRVNPELREYIKLKVLPEYSKNDLGHQLEHINYVIRRSLEFAESITDRDMNFDIVYTAAAYHDIGHHIDATHHEKISADLFRADRGLSRFFSQTDSRTIAEAIEDHRSHRESPPRSVYGKILASADCQIDIDTMLRRTYAYRLRNFVSSSLDEIVGDSRQHLARKYGENGYARDKMYFIDKEFEDALREVQELTSDEQLFRQRFLKANNIIIKNVP